MCGQHYRCLRRWYWCVDLTNVSPAPNNGTEGSLNHLLSSPPTLPLRANGSDYSTGQYPPPASIPASASNVSDSSGQNQSSASATTTRSNGYITYFTTREYITTTTHPPSSRSQDSGTTGQYQSLTTRAPLSTETDNITGQYQTQPPVSLPSNDSEHFSSQYAAPSTPSPQSNISDNSTDQANDAQNATRRNATDSGCLCSKVSSPIPVYFYAVSHENHTKIVLVISSTKLIEFDTRYPE